MTEATTILTRVGSQLWCGVGSGKSDSRAAPADINVLLRSFARSIGLTINPGGKQLTSHRFRKTVARLAALAIDEAPLMLQRLFGHKSIEMTLHYILADKGLAAEIQQVIRELRIMRAKTAIEALVAQEADESDSSAKNGSTNDFVDYGGYGGAASQRLDRAVRDYREKKANSGIRHAAEKFGTQDCYELALILTANGQYFELVRPGVICTKRQGESAPCTKHRGLPDRPNCVPSCENRLEEGWLREDVDGCLTDAVRNFKRARDDGDALMKSFWGGSIVENVGRFSDLRRKWTLDATVQEALRHMGEAEAVV